MSEIARPVGQPTAGPPAVGAPAVGGRDVFLHKAPDWVRHAPNPSLSAFQPVKHVNRHVDAPVLDSFRPPPLHARLRFHPALYPQALERLRERIGSLLQDPKDAALRTRLDAQLRTRTDHVRAYRREAQKLLAC